MSLDRTDKVDFIGIDRVTDSVILTIADETDWEDPSSHLQKLQAKINCYLRFCESGELLDAYPLAKGRRVVIRVVLRHDLPTMAIAFVERAKPVLREAGFALEWETFSGCELKKKKKKGRKRQTTR